MILGAAILVVPGAYFIRYVVRPLLARLHGMLLSIVPWKEFKSVVTEKLRSAVSWRPFRRFLVLLGTLPTWQGIFLVVIISIICGVAMNCLTSWCCPAPASTRHRSASPKKASNAAAPKKVPTQQKNEPRQQKPKASTPRYQNPLQKEDVAAASALDREIAELVRELGQVESQLQDMGVQLHSPNTAADSDSASDSGEDVSSSSAVPPASPGLSSGPQQRRAAGVRS